MQGVPQSVSHLVLCYNDAARAERQEVRMWPLTRVLSERQQLLELPHLSPANYSK